MFPAGMCITGKIFKHVLLVLACADCAVALKVKYHDCGSQSGTVKWVKVEPCDNPKDCSLIRGQWVYFYLAFVPKEVATRVKAVAYGIVNFVRVRIPLPNSNACQNSGLACSLSPGRPYKFRTDMEIKKSYPIMNVRIRVELLDQNMKKLACIVMRAHTV
uniref:ML domain-containing protein n=1 Tax=Trichuris muris TaxID=70415 RepID=A0A5S6QZ92_TRIMR